MVQAYLLTILFSYQRIVMGTFALVQCVDIEDSTVLFIQANVEFDTWWQIGILVYICICVVSIFFVLAHFPYSVRDKKMSVRAFILACLFPLPAITVYYTLKIRNRRCDTLTFLDRDKSETIELSEMDLEGKTEDIITEINDKSSSCEESPLVPHKKATDVADKGNSTNTKMTKTETENIIEFPVEKV